MKLFNKYPFFLTLLITGISTQAKAQAINGDTIYVNTQVEVAVRFPTMPSNFYTNPIDAPYNFKTLSNGFTISAKSKKAKPSPLFVTEGKRVHHFLLMYKKDINYNNLAETDLDYSTVKKLEEHIGQKSAEQEINNKYITVIAEAKANLDQKKYVAAKDGYTQALLLKPNDPLAKKQLEKATKLLDAENKKKEKQKPVTTPVENPTIKPVEPQADQQTYTAEELKSKYPGIDFTKFPPEQQYYTNSFDAKKNAKTLSKILADNPRLDINDKSSKVKLVCQDIVFEGKLVYIKVLIQNNAKKDFLTGALTLIWNKKSSESYGLFPVYLYPEFLPVVKPGNQVVMLYVFQSNAINDEDKLKFQLNDRFNKIKMELNFKGAVYNEAEKR